MIVSCRHLCRIGRSAIGMILLALAAGCGHASQDSGSVVHDSAGITIVENSSAAWAEGEGWRLSVEPVLTIGQSDGPEEYLFSGVLSALRLGTGEFVVANAGTNELRFFDSSGTFVRSIGREGSGPGEFKLMMGIWRWPADSVAVFDYGNARMTVVGPHGEFGRTFRLQLVRSLALPVGPFADGSVLGKSHLLGTETDLPEGTYRGTVLFVHWDSDGEMIDTLVHRPDEERYVGAVAGRRLMASPPFPRGFSVVTAADRWYYGATDRFEIEVYSPDGKLLRLVRCVFANRPVTPRLAEEWRRNAMERYSRMPAPVRYWRANLPVPATMPAHGEFLLDDDGNLWVAHYRLPDEPSVYAVFDPSGRLLGDVGVPGRGSVTHIGSDFMLGIWRDELDVQQIRMYRLLKGG